MKRRVLYQAMRWNSSTTSELRKGQKKSFALDEVLIDIDTPENVQLSAKYSRSWAFTAMHEKNPIIVDRIIEDFSQEEVIEALNQKYPQAKDLFKEVESCIKELEQLKEDLHTSKPFTLLTAEDEDIDLWNKEIDDYQALGSAHYYGDSMLFSQSYFYRRIWDIFSSKSTLNSWDPYWRIKSELLNESLNYAMPLVEYLLSMQPHSPSFARIKDIFPPLSHLVKTSLWSSGIELGEDIIDLMTEWKTLSQWDEYIVVNDSDQLFVNLFSDDTSTSAKTESRIVDYVLNNCGLELLTDFCLADFLGAFCRINSIRFHVKSLPWFVTQATVHDLFKTVDTAAKQNSFLQRAARRWNNYLDIGRWTVHTDSSWTLGRNFPINETEGSLVIVKGDLAYRRLAQDVSWAWTTGKEVLVGPKPVLILRTITSPVVVGVSPSAADFLFERDPDWTTSGQYGLIQFHK